MANLSSMTKSVVASSSASAGGGGGGGGGNVVPGVPIRGEEVAGPPVVPSSSFMYRAPMENIVIKTFQFPVR